MPKAILKFSLPDERNEYACAVNGAKYHTALWDISQWIRSQIKYGDDVRVEHEVVRKMFYDILDTYGINLDEVE
jgi:hypothetical protein